MNWGVWDPFSENIIAGPAGTVTTCKNHQKPTVLAPFPPVSTGGPLGRCREYRVVLMAGCSKRSKGVNPMGLVDFSDVTSKSFPSKTRVDWWVFGRFVLSYCI